MKKKIGIGLMAFAAAGLVVALVIEKLFPEEKDESEDDDDDFDDWDDDIEEDFDKEALKKDEDFKEVSNLKTEYSEKEFFT